MTGALIPDRFLLADADSWTLSAKIKKNALVGEVVWIVGASSGIGEALTYKFVECGAKVILSARREEELRRVQKQCKVKYGSNAEVEVLPMDVLKFESHAKKAAEAIRLFGKLDYVVLNAGRSQRAIIEETELAVDQVLPVTYPTNYDCSGNDGVELLRPSISHQSSTASHVAKKEGASSGYK